MVRFTVGRGNNAVRFERAARHTHEWDEQKKGFKLLLGMR